MAGAWLASARCAWHTCFLAASRYAVTPRPTWCASGFGPARAPTVPHADGPAPPRCPVHARAAMPGWGHMANEVCSAPRSYEGEGTCTAPQAWCITRSDGCIWHVFGRAVWRAALFCRGRHRGAGSICRRLPCSLAVPGHGRCGTGVVAHACNVLSCCACMRAAGVCAGGRNYDACPEGAGGERPRCRHAASACPGGVVACGREVGAAPMLASARRRSCRMLGCLLVPVRTREGSSGAARATGAHAFSS